MSDQVSIQHINTLFQDSWILHQAESLLTAVSNKEDPEELQTILDMCDSQSEKDAFDRILSRNGIHLRLSWKQFLVRYARDNRRDTALMRASTVSAVRLLVESGADVNTKGQSCSLRLMEQGIPYELHGRGEVTALYVAVAELRSLNIADFLLRCGANPNCTEGTYSPLLVAVNSGNVDMARLLLKYNADPNARDNNGRTPLMLAVLQKNLPMVHCLVEGGADKDIRCNVQYMHPLSPFQLAVASHCPEIANYLSCMNMLVAYVADSTVAATKITNQIRELQGLGLYPKQWECANWAA
eukprot:GFYU01004374.1.p1 GENE.GFYU01004374.1~~GFYU01004374.1.p1  ORF type:complete len:346 (-),score=56.57 GFYU01004374.1:292-1185(-)